jgi:2-polyprenyl-3-methyl-5-hydroxy-6-metoxy-1,4-benzoquinol methylase
MRWKLKGFRMSSAQPQDVKGSVGEEAALWALRLFVGREPNGPKELALHATHASLVSLRTAFVQTHEFEAFYQRAQKRRPRYAIPLSFLRAPENAAVPWRFEEPSIADPVSQLCTGGQFDESLYAELCALMGAKPALHRKQWEFVWILSCLRKAGLMRPGARALGFGVGREPLPAVMAAHGVEVTATDAPSEVVNTAGWSTTNQHSSGRDELFRADLVAREAFDSLVSFRPVDMNAIDPDLRGYDACWSSCCFEHLGSIEHGLAFVENSLATLKPGGFAFHTTEFNLASDTDTFESPGTSLFRRQDILRLAGRLIEAGHEVWPLNFHPGTTELDEHIDLPPFSMPHLKLALQRYVSTSIGIAVRRAA